MNYLKFGVMGAYKEIYRFCVKCVLYVTRYHPTYQWHT